jgi:hypothetical protein
MSLFKTWRFRSAHPTFEVGETLNVYLTGFDPASGKGEARIGDTILEVDGASAEQVDTLVVIRVASFDTGSHRGTAALTEG